MLKHAETENLVEAAVGKRHFVNARLGQPQPVSGHAGVVATIGLDRVRIIDRPQFGFSLLENHAREASGARSDLQYMSPIEFLRRPASLGEEATGAELEPGFPPV